MKVLWLIGVTFDNVAKDAGVKDRNFGGGWLLGISNALLRNTDVDVDLCVISPNRELAEVKKGKVGGITYYFFPEKNTLRYDPQTKDYLGLIVNDFDPDVIHIFGTEYPRSYSMIEATGPERVLTSITGSVKRYSDHFFGGVNKQYTRYSLFRRLLRKCVPMQILSLEKEQMEYRALYEVLAIESGKRFIGRTEWDKAFIKQYNSSAEYFLCGEILRDEFYSGVWSYTECKPHRIFVNNGGYPIKGLHYLLRALPFVIQKYPDVEVYIAGNDMLFRKSSIKQLAIRSLDDYSRCLFDLCKKNNILSHVHFTGPLNAAEMKEQYLACEVFVLPSVIENSPNSLGEAMILGVPCVAANVGGVSDMCRDKEEVYLYPHDEYYMLAHYILKIFDAEGNLGKMTTRAKEHACELYSPIINIEKLIDIYSKTNSEYE